MKQRFVQVAIGLAAHVLRLWALAPILGGPVIAVAMTARITGNQERVRPLLMALLPEELHTYSGGLAGFGGPIAARFLIVAFWVLLPLTIYEQVTARRPLRVFRTRHWVVVQAVLFASTTVVGIFLHEIKGSVLTGVVVLCALNGFLFAASLTGFAGLALVNYFEARIADRMRSRSAEEA